MIHQSAMDRYYYALQTEGEMFELFVILNVIYWLIWRPISFLGRWYIATFEQDYLNSQKDNDNGIYP